MKYVLSILLTFTLLSVGKAQSGQMLSAADNDPKATKILSTIRAEYDSFKSMEADFDLTIELPEQEKEVQKGKVIQQGDKFFLDIDQQAIYNDGNYVWLHVKKNNEVQINDPDMGDDTELLSPTDMLTIYESGDYVYSITDSPVVGGKKMTQIDFKPLDRDSEYFKISLVVDKAQNKMHEMKVFSKDGSRFTLKINNIVTNRQYEPSTFTFDESKWPGIHIEDLRID